MSDIAIVDKVRNLCRMGKFIEAIDATYDISDPLLGIKLHMLCITVGELDRK